MTALPTLLLAWLAGAPAPVTAPEALRVLGQVVHENGIPMEGAIIYAIDAGNYRLVASARTDRQGQGWLEIDKNRKVLVGVTMRSFEVARLEIPARDLFRAVLRAPPLPLRSGQALAAARAADPDVDTLDPPPPAPRMTVPVRVLQGTIREDTGGPLAAARVAAFEEHGGQPLGTITADRQGRFAFVLPPGRYRVVPLAPGMRPLRFQRVGQARVRVTMTLDASPDLVEIVVGAEVLTFRMDDSIWPEYVPPPSVKAFLRTRYCSDVNAMFNSVSMQPVDVGPPPLSPGRGNEGLGPQPIPLPLSVAVRRLNLPKYWWLKKLYTAPPNPATCKD